MATLNKQDFADRVTYEIVNPSTPERLFTVRVALIMALCEPGSPSIGVRSIRCS